MKLKDRALQREILEDIGIIDAHMHLNHPPFYVPNSDWKSIIENMDKYGIAKGISSPQLAITCDMERGNDEILEIIVKTDRLLAYCTINPHFYKKTVDELERCFSRGAVAVKIHPSIHKVAVNDKRYFPLYEYASEKGLVILSHSWGENQVCSPLLFPDIVNKFPGVKFIIGHTGGSFSGLKETIEAIKKKPENLFTDLAGSTQYLRRVEILCREVSAENVVFGSDSPWLEPGIVLGAVMFADIPDREKELILSGNIKRILGLG